MKVQMFLTLNRQQAKTATTNQGFGWTPEVTLEFIDLDKFDLALSFFRFIIKQLVTELSLPREN